MSFYFKTTAYIEIAPIYFFFFFFFFLQHGYLSQDCDCVACFLQIKVLSLRYISTSPGLLSSHIVASTTSDIFGYTTPQSW